MEYKGYLVSTDNYMNLQVRALSSLLPPARAGEPSASQLTLTTTTPHAATQLANTEEYQDGASVGSLGEVFIRCVARPASPASEPPLTSSLQLQQRPPVRSRPLPLPLPLLSRPHQH